ncbi:hypothetical protein BRADI_3g37175v3 [Brachypodium distachyon]|uniref:Uncharacterized protein n=1 Tax=Brachypodium distachyon TaxID=15368 RepID=A0A2K2D1N8_BRADI|nr:hypothetical protein BRADI_3g37175v3 [Brachypodium distachyon]
MCIASWLLHPHGQLSLLPHHWPLTPNKDLTCYVFQDSKADPWMTQHSGSRSSKEIKPAGRKKKTNTGN